MPKVEEKKAEKTKKKTATPAQRANQSARTEANKARRAKQRIKKAAKRLARLQHTEGLSRGRSHLRNTLWLAEAREHKIRRVVTVNGSLVVETKPSVGLAKQRAKVKTAWKMPQGWEAGVAAQ